MEFISIPDKRNDRKTFLEKELTKYIGTTCYCPAIGKTIHINKHSIHETIENASITKLSTRMALMLPELIKNGKELVKKTNPESNTQIKTFHFKKIYIIYSEIDNLGIAKIIIGKTSYGKYIHYSLTGIKIYTAY